MDILCWMFGNIQCCVLCDETLFITEAPVLGCQPPFWLSQPHSLITKWPVPGENKTTFISHMSKASAPHTTRRTIQKQFGSAYLHSYDTLHRNLHA